MIISVLRHEPGACVVVLSAENQVFALLLPPNLPVCVPQSLLLTTTALTHSCTCIYTRMWEHSTHPLIMRGLCQRIWGVLNSSWNYFFCPPCENLTSWATRCSVCLCPHRWFASPPPKGCVLFLSSLLLLIKSLLGFWRTCRCQFLNAVKPRGQQVLNNWN